MKTFIVYASETILYEIQIKAHNEADAKEKVLLGNVEFPAAEDSEGFSVDDIVEEGKTTTP